jgi:SAM-dependent methyltransferase
MKEIHFRNLNDLDSEYWWNKVRFEYVRHMILRHKSIDSNILLDIGCGTGSFLSWLKRDPRFSNYTLIGVDSSRQACDFANARDVRALVYDFSVPMKDIIMEEPSVITMLDVLEHISDSVVKLKMIRKETRQDTLLIALVPAFEFLWSPWDEELGHYRRYTKALLLDEICRAGWTPLACQYLFGAMLPLALARKMLINNKFLSPVEFPNTSHCLNNLLTKYFCTESKLASILQFGTSVACIAINH